MPSTADVVRRARIEDARAIAEVQVASWHAAYRGLMPDAKLDAMTVEAREPAWQRILGSETASTTFVLEREGRVIAFGSFGPSRDEPGLGEVWALYAAPDAWRTGAGRALLEHGLAFLRERGFPHAMLWVLEGNVRAIRFYERFGFHGKEPEDKDGLIHRRMRT